MDFSENHQTVQPIDIYSEMEKSIRYFRPDTLGFAVHRGLHGYTVRHQ